MKLEPATLIIGFISADTALTDEVINLCEKKFGPVELISDIIDFSMTDYYREEFGGNLKRRFISFEKLIHPEKIADIKVWTNNLEKKFSRDKKRRINIDPGYIQLGKLVLATTKNQQHRIYIKHGIFAEVTLRFKGRGFTTWEWTYRDYQTNEYIEFFNKVRQKHHEKTINL